ITSVESAVERGLESPSIVFDSLDEAGEPGWIDSPTINQAAKEADIIHSVNFLPTTTTPAQIDNIPATPWACSSIQQFPGLSAGQDIDASDDGPYCAGFGPSQSTIKPPQWTKDSHIPSTLDFSDDGHSLAYVDISGGSCGSVGSKDEKKDEDNDDGSNNGDDSSNTHSDARDRETSSHEQETADYNCEQPLRKRRFITRSLATKTLSCGYDTESCETSGSEQEATDDDCEQPPRKRRITTRSLSTKAPPCGYNDTEYCETSGGEQEAADYDCEQLPRKRRIITRSLATNKPSHGRNTMPQFPASTDAGFIK
ncbi:hypothetical protein ACHAQJ_010640, partial [Trichoderma viride]